MPDNTHVSSALLIILSIAFLLIPTFMIPKNKEGYGGTAWFPYGVMNDITNNMYHGSRSPESILLPNPNDKLLSQYSENEVKNKNIETYVASPLFNYYDTEDRFLDPIEVSPMCHDSIKDIKTAFRTQNYISQCDNIGTLLKRGGNNSFYPSSSSQN